MAMDTKITRVPGNRSTFGAIQALTGKVVLVGVPAEGAVTRTPEEGEPAGITNAQIGYWNEFGVPERNIPARPHLLPGIESAESQITAQMRKAAEAALAGDAASSERALHAVGLIGQSAVQRYIDTAEFAPLAPFTLQMRRARGRTGEKPLIDTGQYRRAITYAIQNRNERAKAAGTQAVASALGL